MSLGTVVWRVVGQVAFMALAASLAAAQGVGNISGTVVDESGAVLPGVTVTLLNPGTVGGNQSAVSDDRGQYQFTRLVPGTYGVRGELSGFTTSVHDDVRVNADVTTRVDMRLGIGGLNETLTVTGQSPLLDTSTALNQAVISRDVLDSLPARNDLWSIGRQVNGVLVNKYDVGGTESYQQSSMTVHGAGGSENTYMIDGMDVGWGGGGGVHINYFDPFMFEEINYQTSNAGAERTNGGVIYNMVTKTGTNSFRAAYMFSGSNRSLSSNNVSADLRRQLLAFVPARVLAANPDIVPGAELINIYDTSLNASGPIVRDRLWYVGAVKFGALNQYRLGSYDPSGAQVLDDNRMRNAAYKLSWQAARATQVHYSYDWNNKSQYHRTGNATTDFAESRAMFRQDQYVGIHQATSTTVLSPTLVMDLGASFQHGSLPSPPQPEVQPGDIPRYDAVLRNHTVAWPTYSDQPGYRGVLRASLNSSRGRHDLKGGYQYMRVALLTRSYSTSHYPSGLRAVYRDGVPDSVNTYNTPTSYEQYSHDHAVYVQDRWTPTTKLTINAGLRVESTSGWQNAACQVETVFIAGRCFDAITGVPAFVDIAPRFAAVYDLFGTGRTALKFSANRYNIPIGIANVARINPIRITNDTRAWVDSNRDLVPQLTELGPSTGFNLGTTNRYADGLERAYASELSVEIEQQLPLQTVLSIGYFNRRTLRNFGQRNTAVPTDSYIPLSVTEVTSGRQVTVYNQAPSLRGRFDVVWDNRPELDTAYNGVDIGFNKRMSDGWMVMGGLSIGRHLGDIYGANGDLNNPNFTFRRGLIGNDVPVSFKLSGVYQLPYEISISGSFQHFTGFPENTTVLVSANTVPLTQVSQSLVVEKRGTTRLPDVNGVDFGIRRKFRFGRIEAEPIMDVFNVFNRSAISARTTQLGPTYGQAANIQRGRLIRFGVNVKL